MKSLVGAGLCGLTVMGGRVACAAPADFVLVNARIYTADPAQSIKQALAVANGKFIYVGPGAGVQAVIGPKTRVEDAQGRLVLPGLIDAHIHPPQIVDHDVCSLESRGVSLEEMAPLIQRCIARYHTKPGRWVAVENWNFSSGNAPSLSTPTLRAALDRASRRHPIELLGNDGHHGAFNSAALARAVNSSGVRVGLSGRTLKRDFQFYAPLVGVDPTGEPDGTVNENARGLMGAPDELNVDLPSLMRTPQKMPQRLNSVGLTAVQDAYVTPSSLKLYDRLLARHKLTVRVNLIQFYEPEAFDRPNGAIDYDRIVARARAVRSRYAGGDLVRSEAVKIFVDGVMEGNPYAVPPTLPSSPSIRPYLQPIFGRDANGALTVTGYVDTASQRCLAVRASPEAYASADAVVGFTTINGYHPGQCVISYGRFQHDRAVILDYAKHMHAAGFALHIHAIGDAAVKTAIDAIEAARAADGNSATPDTLAHLQVVSDEDVARLGRDRLFLAYTYAWAAATPDYDLTVVPFLEHVSGNTFAALHDPASYYERHVYPAKSTQAAGAVLVAGSDAPVDTRDPQPFVNMKMGVTRSASGLPPESPKERLEIRELIDAYTINGARVMGRGDEFGSIEIGKSADFILLNQDILALADAGRAAEISTTKVLETWFRGRQVYRAPRKALH